MKKKKKSKKKSSFTSDRRAMLALKAWRDERPGAVVTIELSEKRTHVALHDLPSQSASTLRGAIMKALIAFKKLQGVQVKNAERGVDG